MMKTIIPLTAAVSLAFGTMQVNAEITVSGYVKNETAITVDTDHFIGGGRTQYDEQSGSRDNHLLKFENSGRAFINGELGEESSWHLDLNLIYDTEGVESEYKGHEWYTQNDWLREAYIDTRWGDADIRIGKQQVVWGTADGIKLLDIVNPTDFREYSQNTMEDSRIPIWMINADMPVGESGSFQVILSEHEENKIPGLDRDGDQGHPYKVKGVDTITGRVNGFLHVAPALSSVASSFTGAAAGGFFGSFGITGVNGLADTSGGGGTAAFTVDFFSRSTWDGAPGPLTLAGPGAASTTPDSVINVTGSGDNGFTLLNAIAQLGLGGFSATPDPKANYSTTSLMNQNVTANWSFNPAFISNTVSWNSAAPESAFELMPMATFFTFNSFGGNDFLGGPGTVTSATTQYVRDYPDDDEGNFGFRYRNTLDNGMNYSLNYFYNYDPNPVVDVSWHDRTTGQELQTRLWTFTGEINRNQVQGDLSAAYLPTTVLLYNPSTDAVYGAFDPRSDPGGALPGLAGIASTYSGTNGVALRFTESLNRTHNLGASFDYALDTETLGPVVLRGEFLYKKDEMHPVIDKRLLAIGDLEGALRPEKHDMFKYVIGADVTLGKNLLVSTQFIQFINLDYQDDGRSCSTAAGGFGFAGTTFDCSRYTGDAPTLHLSNGLQEAEEYKEFVSIFLSKPFGSDEQGRWNNILILEDNGGKWNRFDVEWGFSDTLIGTFEWNAYWGEEDSWFGQMHNTSNLQVGLKYIFE